MRPTWSWVAGGLLLLLASRDAGAKDVPIPGLEMDEVSQRVMDAWDALEFNLGRDGLTYCACRVSLALPNRLGDPVGQGEYRFELTEGTLSWLKGSERGFDQAWWRQELDNWLRMPSRKFFLARCKLVGVQDATGTRIEVKGQSPYRAFRFDARGVLTGVTVAMPGPGGRPQTAEVALEHRPHGQRYLLHRYTMTGSMPGVGPVSESGRVEWVRLLGRPVPSSIALDLRMGGRRAALLLTLDDWKIGTEVGPTMDHAARVGFTHWERSNYNLGLQRVLEAECRVAVSGGGHSATGRYTWDGEKGRLAWNDEAAAKALRGDEVRADLRRIFERHSLRRALFGWSLRGRWKEGRTTVRADDELALDPAGQGPRSRRFVIDKEGRLVEMTVGGTAEHPEGVVRVAYRRVEHGPGTPLAGSLRYHLPVTWAGAWTPPFGDPYTTTKSMTYAVVDGLHVPGALTIRFEDAEREGQRTFRFSEWKLVKEPRELGD